MQPSELVNTREKAPEEWVDDTSWAELSNPRKGVGLLSMEKNTQQAMLTWQEARCIWGHPTPDKLCQDALLTSYPFVSVFEWPMVHLQYFPQETQLRTSFCVEICITLSSKSRFCTKLFEHSTWTLPQSSCHMWVCAQSCMSRVCTNSISNTTHLWSKKLCLKQLSLLCDPQLIGHRHNCNLQGSESRIYSHQVCMYVCMYVWTYMVGHSGMSHRHGMSLITCAYMHCTYGRP